VTRAAACAALVVAAACGGSAPATRRVEIRDFRYHPDTLAAAPGDTIEWANHDVVPHTATMAGAWSTGEIGGGASGRVVVAERGTHEYVCAFHPTMRAVLVIH